MLDIQKFRKSKLANYYLLSVYGISALLPYMPRHVHMAHKPRSHTSNYGKGTLQLGILVQIHSDAKFTMNHCTFLLQIAVALTIKR